MLAPEENVMLTVLLLLTARGVMIATRKPLTVIPAALSLNPFEVIVTLLVAIVDGTTVEEENVTIKLSVFAAIAPEVLTTKSSP